MIVYDPDYQRHGSKFTKTEHDAIVGWVRGPKFQPAVEQAQPITVIVVGAICGLIGLIFGVWITP